MGGDLGSMNKHPGTPATAIATTEALRLLVRADRISEMQAKADSVKLDEAAWRRAIYVVVEAAANKKDYNYLISKTQDLSQSAVDLEIKAFAHKTLGDAYWKKGETEQARAAFQAVVAQYPKTPYAEEAEGNLMEMELLNPGQPAPQFARTTIKGDPISLAGFKGKVVVLKFWGTY
jgi:tetratricopeptide (TPR) repeat protein